MKCGACCKWDGFVRLTENDINKISSFLNLSIRDFVDKYTILSHDRISLSLMDNNDKSCIFLGTNNECLINNVKPAQCKNFPDKWNFPGYKEVCKA